MAKIKALPAPPPRIDDEDDEPDCPRCPPVGAPAWMATFADMATLLMAFFVLILSFANFDEVSFKKMTGALREHFGVRPVELMPEPESNTLLKMDFRPANDPQAPDATPQDARAGEGGTGPEGAEDAEAAARADEALEMLRQALASGEVTVAERGETAVLRLPDGMGAKDLVEALARLTDPLAGAKDSAGPQEDPQPGSGAAAEQGSAEQQATGTASGGEAARRKAAIADARLRVALRELVGEGLVDVQQEDDKVFVTVGAGGAFVSGSADLTDEARAIMERIALASAADQSRITVTGHTDSVPLTGGPFVDNWGLAAARASSVVRELGGSGLVDPRRLQAVSKGESDPVADNATEEGRAQNRRIEIVIDYAQSAG